MKSLEKICLVSLALLFSCQTYQPDTQVNSQSQILSSEATSENKSDFSVIKTNNKVKFWKK